MNFLRDNFNLYYPHYASKAVEYRDLGHNELLVKLEDGRVITYYDPLHSTMRLPDHVEDIDEEMYKRLFKFKINTILFTKGLTQSDIAERTGIPQSLISNYVTGDKIPSFYRLYKIANALGCSVKDLVYEY